MRSAVFALSFTAACFLSAGCGGENAKKDDPKSGNSGNGSIRLNNIPTFATTSNEPVLLRYKMKTGQTLKMVVDVDMDMKVHMGAQEQKIKQTLVMEAQGKVTAVDDKSNSSVDVKLTRMKMTMSGPANLDFDSDKPKNVAPNLKPLLAMINVNIPCRITPVGKMLETDLEPLRVALRKSGNAAFGKVLDDSMGKMFEGTFVYLSETPVKTGDSYKAGTVVNDKVKVHMSYKIGAVSGDKSQAVLEPVAVLEMAPGAFPGGEGTIKSQQVAGWILFDLVKGYGSKGEVHMHIVMDVKAQGQAGTVDITSKTRVTTSLD